MNTHVSKVYNIDKIRKLEELAVMHGISPDELMHRAGKAAFQALKEQWPEAISCIVYCGIGNNGGDGYVVAKLAKEAGLDVSIRYLNHLERMTEETRRAYEACSSAGIEMKTFDEQEMVDADVIVDALFGIGLNREVEGLAVQAIEQINAAHCSVLAIDIPSGLNADTGAVLGSVVYADCTVTFIGLKQGLFTGSALGVCGKIIEADLELPPEHFKSVEASCELISTARFQAFFEPRLLTSYKGDFGHVLVIGGDIGMPGAPKMAALASLRVGAGLVTIATFREHASVLISDQPEIMCKGIAEAHELEQLLKRITTIVLGPGLGRSSWSESIFDYVINSKLPMVVDADGLNLLAKKPMYKSNWILTPHIGEAARLLNCSTSDIQKDRFAAAREVQKRFGGICILKGAGTLVVDDENQVFICVAGNPGMASGGMGDVLSGIIGGLLAQHFHFATAAQASVCVHSEAADAAVKTDGERGLVATDLLPFVRKLVNNIRL